MLSNWRHQCSENRREFDLELTFLVKYVEVVDVRRNSVGFLYENQINDCDWKFRRKKEHRRIPQYCWLERRKRLAMQWCKLTSTQQKTLVHKKGDIHFGWDPMLKSPTIAKRFQTVEKIEWFQPCSVLKMFLFYSNTQKFQTNNVICSRRIPI